MRKSILQEWVTELGLRHQGVLVSAIRGCDTAPKEDASKLFARAFRSYILNAHCGDATKAQTYIQGVTLDELEQRFNAFRRNLDHYPHHYVMHMVHAIEIVGRKHNHPPTRRVFFDFYQQLCKGLHVNMESAEQLDDRLNASEAAFGAANRE